VVFERVEMIVEGRGNRLKEDGYRVKNHRGTKLSSNGDELSDWLITISGPYGVNR
jgi:hypothetical protein